MDINAPQAVIYCRVSSTKQVRDGHGLSSQDTRCREYCRHKGYEVVESYHEEGLSGSLLDRPKMNQMLKFLRKNKDKGIIVVIDDISRLARNIETHIQLRTTISAAGGKLESPSIEFGDDSDSRLVEHLLASVAAHSREKNTEQVKHRMRARVMNGYWISYPPFGYRFEKVQGHGKLLVRDEPLFSIIQEALEGYASGRFNSQSAVKTFLEQYDAFPKKKNGQVRYQQVRDVLTRVLYAGRITMPKWGVYNHPAKHEPMISFETFQKIQARLNETAKAPTRKDLNKAFPLRGGVCCSSCNHPYTSCWSKGRSKHYGYYLCHRKGCPEYGKSISKDKMESQFEALLKDMRPSPQLFSIAVSMFEDLWKERNKSGDARRKEIEKELQKVERGIAQLLDRIIESENRTVVNSYEKKIEAMEDEKIVLKEKIANCGRELPDFDRSFRTALSFLANPHKMWASGELEHQRAAMKLCFSDYLVYDRFEGFRTAAKALPFRVSEGFEGGGVKMVGPHRLELWTYRL